METKLIKANHQVTSHAQFHKDPLMENEAQKKLIGELQKQLQDKGKGKQVATSIPLAYQEEHA